MSNDTPNNIKSFPGTDFALVKPGDVVTVSTLGSEGDTPKVGVAILTAMPESHWYLSLKKGDKIGVEQTSEAYVSYSRVDAISAKAPVEPPSSPHQPMPPFPVLENTRAPYMRSGHTWFDSSGAPVPFGMAEIDMQIEGTRIVPWTEKLEDVRFVRSFLGRFVRPESKFDWASLSSDTLRRIEALINEELR